MYDSRGASILAALFFVGILGVIAFTLQILNPPSRIVSLTADPQSQVAQAAAPGSCKPSTGKDPCNPGEVHTVDMSKGSAQCTQEKGVKCWVKNTQGQMVPGPDASNPACRDSSKTTCVVRYCPPSAVSTIINLKEGTCIVIQCTQGTSANECLKNNFNSAQAASTPTAYSAFANSLVPQHNAGQVTMDVSPYSVNGSEILTNTYNQTGQTGNLQTVQAQLSQNQAQLNNVQQQLNNCAFSGDGCNPTTVQNLQNQQANLQAQNYQLQWQMDALSKQQAQIIPPTTGPGTYDPGTKGAITSAPGATCDANFCGATPRDAAHQADLERRGYSCWGNGSATYCVAPLTSQGGGVGQTFPQQQLLSGYQPLRPAQQSPWYQLGRMIGSLFSGSLTGNSQQQTACATNRDQYDQQIQQYQYQQQQYNYQMQQYNYQQQQQYYQQQYGYSNYSYSTATPPPPPTQPPQPCYNNANPTQCSASPQQPSSAQCTNGTWKPTTAAGNGCVSGWQCVPKALSTGGTGGTGTTTENTQQAKPQTPTAQISCQPQFIDVGMKLAISFACQNALMSSGHGFDTEGQLSGSTEVIVAKPALTRNTATYSLTCTNGGITSGAECSVQVSKPAIILVVNPARVQQGEPSAIGWVTSGMHSCVVSSPQMTDFTAKNANNTDVNGVALTPSITMPTDIFLRCTTLGGATRTATTTIRIL